MSERVEILLKLIREGPREDVWEAAKELFDTSSAIALSLIRTLEEAKDTEARAAAAWALGLSGFAPARESLEGVLRDVKEEPSVRYHAAEGLGNLADPRSVPALSLCLDERDAGLKYWCAFALGQIGDPSAVPTLRRLAETAGDDHFENHSLRVEALDAISQIDHIQRLRR